MPAIAHPTWLGLGILLFLAGLWFWRWSSRNSLDLKGAAMSAALQGVRQGRLDMPDDLKSRVKDIANETSNTKRVAKAGGMAARHFIAKIFGLVGLAGMLGGLALAAAGIWWK
jgi:hypothetical protein